MTISLKQSKERFIVWGFNKQPFHFESKKPLRLQMPWLFFSLLLFFSLTGFVDRFAWIPSQFNLSRKLFSGSKSNTTTMHNKYETKFSLGIQPIWFRVETDYRKIQLKIKLLQKRKNILRNTFVLFWEQCSHWLLVYTQRKNL